MRRQIILVPIEPLDQRYSIEWLSWFNQQINRDGRFDLVVVDPKPLTTEITSGAFLDVCGTNYYKSQQLAMICKLVHEKLVTDNAVFIFLDAWFPGVEMLAYMRDALKMNFAITGCMHAGTYDPTDYISKMGMGHWGLDLENSWLRIYDRIFVATEYHRDLILSERDADPTQVVVTGFPIKKPVVMPWNKPAKIVVFPHRLTEDKQPELFDAMAARLKVGHPDWLFVRTQDLRMSKQAYHSFLSQCSIAVSFAKHENWGIAMQEAAMLGCIPFVPDRLSYKEMYPDMFRYSCLSQLDIMIRQAMAHVDNKSMPAEVSRAMYTLQDDIINKGAKAIPNMLEIIHAI